MKYSSFTKERTKNNIKQDLFMVQKDVVQLNQDVQELVHKNANRVEKEVGIKVLQSLICLGGSFFGVPSGNYADLAIYFMLKDKLPKEWPSVAVYEGRFFIRQSTAKTALEIEQLQKLVKIYFNAVLETE